MNSGYATQDQIRNYDPRYYAISLEFKTFDENALLLMVVNHENQQNMLIQLQEGMVKFIINYGNNVKLEFSTKNTYNSGQWVKIEAGRAYRKGIETGVLRVTHSGVREDLMDTLPSLKVINWLVREIELLCISYVLYNFYENMVKNSFHLAMFLGSWTWDGRI